MKEISDGHYNKLKEHVKLGCLAVALSSAAGKADGAAFDLPVQDAFATARGEAFVATADNP
jgi:hypothetical protein